MKPCWLIWSRTLTSVEGLHRRPRAVYKYWASYVELFAFSRVGVEKETVDLPQLQFSTGDVALVLLAGFLDIIS